MTGCPCPDPACSDVHAHDVTGQLAMTIDVTQLLSGMFQQQEEGVPGDG